MNTQYRIQLASLPDREQLVAEILFDDIQWAELNHDQGPVEVEFYARPDNAPWRIPYDVALSALRDAKARLRGP
jgi:hypothetical protein